MVPSRPKLPPRRFRSSSASRKTRSSLVWSPALPGRAATRPASIFCPLRLGPSGWDSCTTWCPRPFGLPCWSIRPTLGPPRLRYATYRTPPVQWDCKFRSSRPAPGARAKQPSATLVQDRADALFVAPDGFFTSRRVQFATPAARHAIPAAYSTGGGWADELRDRYSGLLSSGRRLHRSNPQGREARRPAGLAVDQMGVRHQHADGQGAWP